MCTLGTTYPQLFVNVLQIYISSLHQIVCARKDINTKAMFRYFQQNCRGKILWHVYIRHQTTVPQLFAQGRRAQKKFLNKWENLASHSKFQ